MACILKKKNNAFIRGFASRRLEIFIRHHPGALENLRLDPRPVLALRIFRSVVLDGIKAVPLFAIPGMARRWQTLCKAFHRIFLPLFCL